MYRSLFVQCLVLWYCDPKVVGLNQVGSGQGYELFREIALENLRLDVFITML